MAIVWLFLAVGLTGFFQKSLKKSGQNRRAILLGSYLGLGFYTYITALPAIVFLSVWTANHLIKRNSKYLMSLFCLTFPIFLLGLPLAEGLLRNIFHGHISQYLIFDLSGPAVTHPWVTSLSYLTVLLWGPLEQSYFNFGPLWGGFLNPILGSLFLLGLIDLFHSSDHSDRHWVFGAFLTGLFPGILSNNLEMMRISPLMPLCVAVTAVGGRRFLLAFPKTRRMPLFLSILFFSFLIDSYHLEGPYHQWSIPGKHSQLSKSVERYQAFQILEKEEKNNGPGLIFSNFMPVIFDQSLLISTYPFNAVKNKKLSSEKIKWAALLVPPTYDAQLASRFPQAVPYPLSNHLDLFDEALTLWVIPLSPKNEGVFNKWISFEKWMDSLYGEIPFGIKEGSYDPLLTKLMGRMADFEGDSLLESCLWAKIAEYAHDGKNIPLFLRGMDKVIQFNHAQSHLLYDRGLVNLQNGKYLDAKKDFLSAGRLNAFYQPPEESLKRLDQLQKTR